MREKNASVSKYLKVLKAEAKTKVLKFLQQLLALSAMNGVEYDIRYDASQSVFLTCRTKEGINMYITWIIRSIRIITFAEFGRMPK